MRGLLLNKAVVAAQFTSVATSTSPDTTKNKEEDKVWRSDQGKYKICGVSFSYFPG
jgi:hypothetical protein